MSTHQVLPHGAALCLAVCGLRPMEANVSYFCPTCTGPPVVWSRGKNKHVYKFSWLSRLRTMAGPDFSSWESCGGKFDHASSGLQSTRGDNEGKALPRGDASGLHVEQVPRYGRGVDFNPYATEFSHTRPRGHPLFVSVSHTEPTRCLETNSRFTYVPAFSVVPDSNNGWPRVSALLIDGQ
jgi:hypothetical protein